MRVTVLCCLLIAAIEARYQEVVSGNDQDVCKKKNGETRQPGPPSFKKAESERQTLAAGHMGHRIELFCSYHPGCPRANISWTKDGLPLQERGRDSGLYSTVRIHRNGKLVIEDNRKTDDGQYTCTVSNRWGSIQHSIRVQGVERVVAQAPSVIPGQPGNHSLEIGGTVELSCRLTVRDVATPHTITWFKHFKVNGSWTDTGDNDGIPYVTELQASNDSPPPPDDSVLVLTNLTEEDSGLYSCAVKNQYGGDLGSGWLTVSRADVAVKSLEISWPIYIVIPVFLVVGIIFFSISCCFWRRYSNEKKNREFAIKNAKTVASWTKKIMVEKQQPEICFSTELYVPQVRIEKVRMEKSKIDLESCDGISEYEFPEDIDWEFPRDLLEFGKVLGEGTFGKVVTGIAHNTSLKLDIPSLEGNSESGETRRGQLVTGDHVQGATLVAVKMLKEGHTDAEMIDFVKEMEMMKNIPRHVNIINLLGVCARPVGQQLLVIVEYAEHGNLRDHLRARSPDRRQCPVVSGEVTTPMMAVSLRDMLNWGWQVARGMQWLHTHRCVHRDLAARNVLVCADGVVKIADFGLARDLSESEYYRKNSDGKLPVKWMSPESLFDRKCTAMSDIWSFGVLLWEIITWGDTPYKTVPTLEALLELIKDGYRMGRPGHCPWRLWEVIKSCWMHHPEARPGWPQLITSLLALYNDTLPGEYLELSRTSLPTPPSSPENTGDGFPLTRLVTRGQGEVTYRALPHVPVQREISGYYHQTKYQDPATLASFTRSNDNPRHEHGHMERKSKTHSYQEDYTNNSGYQIMKHNNNREDVERLLRSRCFSERVVTRLDSEDSWRLENRSSSESGYQTRGEERDMERDMERGEWDEVFTDTASKYRSQYVPIKTMYSEK